MVNGLIMRSRGSSLMHLDNSLKFKLRRKVTLMTLNVEGCWALDCTHSCPTGLQKRNNNAVSSSSVIPATGKRPVIQMQQSLIYLLQQKHAEQQLYSTCQQLAQEPTQASPAAEDGKLNPHRLQPDVSPESCWQTWQHGSIRVVSRAPEYQRSII